MRTISFICLLVFSLCAHAQRGTIKGGIIDPIHEQGVMEAKVSLLRPDSSLVDTVRTDIPLERTSSVDGNMVFSYYTKNLRNPATFAFSNMEPGIYILKVEMDGYDTLIQPIEAVFSGRDKSFDCGDLWLYEIAKQLGEAGVVGTRLLLVNKGDTLIYNVGAIQTSEGDMLGNLIEKLPGASIDDEGKIYVNGRYVENLLINDKDFFNGDIKSALASLPAYTVNKIKTYEREGERSLTTGTDMGDKQFVMDVNLKRQYEKTWSGDFEARGGTKERYLLYANIMRMDQRQMFIVRGEANNMNTSKSNFGSYVYDQFNEKGIRTYRSAYINYQYEPDRNLRFGVNGLAKNTRERTEINTSTETYLSENNTFGRSEQEGRSVSTRAQASANLSYRPAKGWFVNGSYIFNFNKNHSNSDFRSASYLFNPDKLFKAHPLDSTFILSTCDALLKEYVQSRLIQESLTRSHSTKHSANMQLQKAFGIDLLSVDGSFSRENSATKTYDLYDLRNPHSSQMADDFRHRFYNKSADVTNASAGADYTYKYIQNDSVDGQLVVDYSYNLYDNDSNNPLYRLDQLVNYTAEQSIDMLPSTRNALLAALDAPNSYYSQHTRTNHTAKLTLNQKLRLPNHTWVSIVASLPFNYCADALNYERNNLMHRVDNNGKFLNPSLTLAWNPQKDDKDGSYAQLQFEFKSEGSLPDPYNLVDITDESDPLSTWTGTPGLKNPRTNTYKLTFRNWNQKTMRNVMLMASFTQNNNDIATQYIYNRETGAVQRKPLNVDGNWNLFFYEYFSLFFDKAQKWHFSLQTNFNLINSRDLNYWEAEAANNRVIQNVRTIQATPMITLRYNINSKVNCGLHLNSKWQHMTGDRSDYATTNAWHLNYALDLSAKLPLDFEFSSDISAISRFGYSDNTLNDTRVLWNAKLTRMFKHDFSLSLQAYDILHQNKSVESVVNAQGRTETYSLVLPAYITIGLKWKFNRIQGTRKMKKATTTTTQSKEADSIREIKL